MSHPTRLAMLRSSAVSRLSAKLSVRSSPRPIVHAFLSARFLPPSPSPLAFTPRQALYTPPVRYFNAATSARSPPLKACPSCSSPLPTPLPACPNCFNISRLPSTVSYHEIFGLPYDPNPFEVDIGVLRSRFRNLQRVIHPDKWSGKSNASLISYCLYVLSN